MFDPGCDEELEFDEEEEEEEDEDKYLKLKKSWTEVTAKKLAAEKEKEAPKRAGVKIVGGREVTVTQGICTWEQGGHRYHINLRHGFTAHVTQEDAPRTQFFFKFDAGKITSTRPDKTEVGSKPKSKKMFHHLPLEVQDYIRAHFAELT